MVRGGQHPPGRDLGQLHQLVGGTGFFRPPGRSRVSWSSVKRERCSLGTAPVWTPRPPLAPGGLRPSSAWPSRASLLAAPAAAGPPPGQRDWASFWGKRSQYSSDILAAGHQAWPLRWISQLGPSLMGASMFPGDRKHIPVLLHGVVHRYHGAAVPGALHRHHPQGQPADDPVAHWERLRLVACARRVLADERPAAATSS